MNFTVIRSEWCRGSGSDESALLRPDGMKCCLGFRELAAGLTEDQILRVETCNQLIDKLGYDPDHDRKLLDIGYRPEAEWRGCTREREIIRINDDKDLTDPEREIQLTTLFSEIGDTVTFVD